MMVCAKGTFLVVALLVTGCACKEEDSVERVRRECTAYAKFKAEAGTGGYYNDELDFCLTNRLAGAR